MECYYGLETEDLVVPTDQELLDMSSPSDSWPEWETGWTMNFDPVKKTDQKNYHKTLFGKPNSHTSLQESENPYAFPMADGWSEDPWCGNSTQHDRPDFQFNDLTRNNQMDDIFIKLAYHIPSGLMSASLKPGSHWPQPPCLLGQGSSLLKEDLPQPEKSDEQSFSETRFCSMPADGNSTDLMFDSECISGVIQSTESPQNFRACVQSPSVKWEVEQVTTSSTSNGTNTGLNDHPVAKALESKVLHPSCEKSSNKQYRNTGGETSLEESLLQNLEFSLTHLHQNTRLCFRDSLYRLAHNSIQQTSHQGRAKQAERGADDQRIRSGGNETAESETNTIDRAVANFMFKNVDYNTKDLVPVMSAAKGKRKAVQETKGSKYISFSPPEIYHYPPT